jgi:hypothetical protein
LKNVSRILPELENLKFYEGQSRRVREPDGFSDLGEFLTQRRKVAKPQRN